MGQIVGLNAKCKRANLNALGSVPTPANGEIILVSSDNSMDANGQGNFDCYIVGDGTKLANQLQIQKIGLGTSDIINTIDCFTEYGTTYVAGAGAVQNAVVTIDGSEKRLTSSDFEQGTLNPNDGTIYNNSPQHANRIRTDYIKVLNGDVISFTLNGQKYIVYYYDTLKGYISATDWSSTDSNVNISDDGYVKILIAKTDNTAITPSGLAAYVDIERLSVINSIIQNVETIDGQLYNSETLTSSDFEQGTINSSTGKNESSTTRLRTKYIRRVNKYESIKISTGGQQFVIDYYSLNGSFIEATSWSSSDTTITFPNDCLIRLLVSKQDSSTITTSQLNVKFSFITNKVNDIQSSIDTTESSIDRIVYDDVFLGTLVQKSLTASGLSDSTVRVSMQSCTVVPYVGAQIHFKLPVYYYIGIRSGNTAGDLSYNDYWYGDGATYTFRSDVRYFRLCFGYAKITDFSTNGTFLNVTPAAIQELIDDGEIKVYISKDNTSVERNFDCEKYAKAIMRPFVSGASNNYSLQKLPIFLHTSDVHGDAKRFENFMDYADYLEVDAALISGDMLANNKSNSKVFIDDIASLHSTADLQCIGNHESYNATIQEESEMLASCIQRNSCTVNSNEQYPTYYYKDIAGKNMRIIALNLYSVQGSNDTWRFTQVQCEWLIAALASTPANYGVIVMMHAPEVIPPIDEQYGKFRQAILNYTDTGALAARPLANIIDAFIGKESRTITYTSHSTDISVSADFTSVNSGVEFIAYVNGHLHTDTIGFVPNTTHRQLVLNVCCGIGIYGTTYPYLANNSDLPRDGKGATQDSFNLYAIDRSSGTVRVAKIGSNTTGNMETRDWMIIPYKQ